MGNVKVNLKITGERDLKRKLDELGAKARGALLKAAQAGGEVIQADANGSAPGPHVVVGNGKVEGGRAEVSIGPDKEHWYYQFFETGASEHEIKGSRKRKGKAIAFEGDDGLVVTGSVDHPGIEAKPFLRPAIDRRKEQARDRAGKVFKEEIDRMVD